MDKNIEKQLALVTRNTIFEVRHGSHAYGTNIATSDIDKKGICLIPDPRLYFGSATFEQQDGGWVTATGEKEDKVVYHLPKFIELAAACNPNIIEVLFADEGDILVCTKEGQRLRDNRDLFLSRKARHTFTGYAAAQLKRMKAHYRWLSNPPEKPESAAAKHIKTVPVGPLGTHLAQSGFLKAIRVAAPTTFFERALARVGLARRNQQWFDLDVEVFDKGSYEAAKKEYENYETWVKNRNQKRSELEKQHGYDCYHERTEFLTEDGWRTYDQIPDGLGLVTVNPVTLKAEVQVPYERVCKEYRGDLIVFENQQTKCVVTPNHRMFVSNVHRGRHNNFSSSYEPEQAEWYFASAEKLLSGNQSYFHALNRAAMVETDFCVPTPDGVDADTFLTLLGAYISEGSVGKLSTTGDVRALNISQKVGGRLCAVMAPLEAENVVYHRDYVRDESWRATAITERTYVCSEPDVASLVASLCGIGSLEKHLPAWAKNLSYRQAWLLLTSMIAGDGTDRGENRSFIYYTASRQLADDIQEMCVRAGITSQVWGPYHNDNGSPMFQVYIRKPENDVQAGVMRARETAHVSRERVEDVKIVCFSVPNETLITRIDGKVSLQGNTKHGMHLVRLLRMGLEIVSEGKVIVKRPDREELLAIRNGAWSYDKIIAYADEMEKKIEEAEKTSKLPRAPNLEKIEELQMDLVRSALKKTGAI